MKPIFKKLLFFSLFMVISVRAPETIEEFTASLEDKKLERLQQILNHYTSMYLNPTHHVADCDLCHHSDTGEACTTAELAERKIAVKSLIDQFTSRRS